MAVSTPPTEEVSAFSCCITLGYISSVFVIVVSPRVAHDVQAAGKGVRAGMHG